MNSSEEMNKLIAVELADYHGCLDVLEHDYEVNGVNARVRLHYVKFDGNGMPMIKSLATMLYSYIIDYCLAARNRNESLSPRQSTKLTKEARDLFRHPEITDTSPDNTGESGEILLYFLMEAILKAPQMVSKMELKTNHRDEVKGSDGIHARYNDDVNLVEFFFGESKLYKSSSAAIAAAIESIDQFHEVEMYQHEFNMVTKHFKYANDSIKEAITSLIIHGEPGPSVRVCHACLIGYDFKGYDGLQGFNPAELTSEFLAKFEVDGIRLTNLLQKRLDLFDKKHLWFDVFFIPFPSVVEFRNAFNKALD